MTVKNLTYQITDTRTPTGTKWFTVARVLLMKQGVSLPGGFSPDFCTRVCQRGLRTHTLSLVKCAKKTPFLLQFFWGKHAVFVTNLAKMYLFLNMIAEKWRVAPKILENCRQVIHSLPKNTPFLLHFLSKKHTLSLAFFVKITPSMLAHQRYPIYSE